MFAAAEASCTSCPFLHVFAKKIAQCFPPCSEFAAFHNSLQNRLSVSFPLAVAPFCFSAIFLSVSAALSLFTVLTSTGVKWRRLRRHRGGREEEWRSEETLDTTSDGLERQRKEGDLWWEKK